MKPTLSAHFQSRQPSSIRLAQMEFAKRKDGVRAVNVAIGNVSLPMHPAMRARLEALEKGFPDGVVKYTETVGTEEANKAVLNIIASSGFSTQGLYSQITDGGSQAIELAIVGCCGPAGTKEKPLLLIDPAYTNYKSFAERLGRATVSIQRGLGENGEFALPDISEIEAAIIKHNPGALVAIPYDNPTGQLYSRGIMLELAGLCAKHNLWLVSDEAYRELNYRHGRLDSASKAAGLGGEAVSVWGITNKDVPGIEGRRISIESASKVWNACGLRIGALLTDNKVFHEKSVAENTAGLCPNAIGQYIFGALAQESRESLQAWYSSQRDYYTGIMSSLAADLKAELPGLIVSKPEAAIYFVIDVRNIAKPGFDSMGFVLYCARKGSVPVGSEELTLLVAPMQGFYSSGQAGKTQMRIACVQPPGEMGKVPRLFSSLFKQYEEER